MSETPFSSVTHSLSRIYCLLFLHCVSHLLRNQGVSCFNGIIHGFGKVQTEGELRRIHACMDGQMLTILWFPSHVLLKPEGDKINDSHVFLDETIYDFSEIKYCFQIGKQKYENWAWIYAYNQPTFEIPYLVSWGRWSVMQKNFCTGFDFAVKSVLKTNCFN